MDAEKFSRYEIKEVLGIGGMATVYRAYDPMFDREVALKVLKRELLEDPQLRERFERETKIIAKLEHAAIVPVYDVGHDHNQLFYVMRLMTGSSLSERIQNGSLTLNQVAHIFMRIADALDYAHRKGVVHRDLKPGNILFDEINNAFISDFGIAKFAQADTRITHSGILGTPRYISPEQARGEDADGRSDLYSLAVILFEILSGKAPFEATTPLAMAFKHATEPAPNILEINPNLPEGLGDVLKKALEKQPDDRYNTCVEFANAFLAAIPDSSKIDINSVTPLPSWVYKNIESPTRLPTPTSDTESQAKPRPKLHLRWIIEIAMIALLGLLIGGYPYFTSNGNASTLTPKPAAVINASTTPTDSPTSTPAITPSPTAEPTETLMVDPGIGGARKIAVTSNRDIYLMDMDGKNIQQITNSNIPKFDLQWLPNGTELLYGENKCIYKIDAETLQTGPEKVGCFSAEYVEGFRVSPDGKYIAISIERRLIILPFDTELLSTAKTAFELQHSEKICVDYADVAVKGAVWSANGTSLAIRYQSIVGQHIGETVRIIKVDLNRCKATDPLMIDEFPNKQFIPMDYESKPIIPSYNWDGGERFIFNTYQRNDGYGELYLYDMNTSEGSRINPINGTCCYRSAVFSPDGTYILFVYQDKQKGSESESLLYYVPVDQIGTGATFTPLHLPFRFFKDIRENILTALQPSMK